MMVTGSLGIVLAAIASAIIERLDSATPPSEKARQFGSELSSRLCSDFPDFRVLVIKGPHSLTGEHLAGETLFCSEPSETVCKYQVYLIPNNNAADVSYQQQDSADPLISYCGGSIVKDEASHVIRFARIRDQIAIANPNSLLPAKRLLGSQISYLEFVSKQWGSKLCYDPNKRSVYLLPKHLVDLSTTSSGCLWIGFKDGSLYKLQAGPDRLFLRGYPDGRLDLTTNTDTWETWRLMGSLEAGVIKSFHNSYVRAYPAGNTDLAPAAQAWEVWKIKQYIWPSYG